MKLSSALVGLVIWGCLICIARGTDDAPAGPWKAFEDGRFAWKCSPPLIDFDRKAADPHVSIKDPTIVRHQGKWHLFCTVRMASGKVDTQYLSFDDWKNANAAARTPLNLHDQYYCAPQVFFFRPQNKWYLLYQIRDKDHVPPWGPAVSTSSDIGDPKSWTKPTWIFDKQYKGLDYWMIGDGKKMYLLFTSLDGRMWRSGTSVADFPKGFSEPAVVLTADIFEASHTYKLKGLDKYLTIVEAQGENRRYYKAYLADRLDGIWKPLADTIKKPFAGLANIQQEQPWTASISHGELIRTGADELMEVDPAHVQFLFQGASDDEYRNSGGYGKIPWRLGMLEGGSAELP